MNGEKLEDEYLLYLQKSISLELSRRLSTDAKVVLPPSDDFESANLRFTNWDRPNYIVAVKVYKENDVVETVNYARARGIPFAARSGGHCVTNSMKKLQNGIVIDLRGLNSLCFDATKRQVKVGGGVTTGDFANFVHKNGMEVTVGSCPTTGIFGVSFGAGIGRLQGKYGYLSDNMISARLLLANGAIVTTSESINQDLFWAIRGAGHNFGIALEATFQVYPQQNKGIHHNFEFEYSLNQLESVFDKMNDLTPRMPAELAIFILSMRRSFGGNNIILVNLVYSGPEEDAVLCMAEFEALNPVWTSGKMTTTWDRLPWITYHHQNDLMSKPEAWKSTPYRIFSAVSVKSYDLPTCRAYFESLAEMNDLYAGKARFGAMFESFPHQKVHELKDESTAFPWRHGSQHFLMLAVATNSLEDGEVYERYLNEYKQAFIKTSGYGRLQQYVNYGHGTSILDPVEALYGYEPWRLEKLRRLKREYDPEGLFNWYQPFV